jgi:hypothetical protein
MQKLYKELRLEMTYHAENMTVNVVIRLLGGGTVRVRDLSRSGLRVAALSGRRSFG